MLHHDDGFARFGEQVEVADRFAPAAIAAGRHDTSHCRTSFKIRDERPHAPVGLGPVNPLLGGGGQIHAGENRFLGLGPKTFKIAHTMGLTRFAQLVECVNAKFLMERRGLLRPQPRNTKQEKDTGRNFQPQLFEQRHLAGVDELRDFFGQVLADAANIGQPPLGIAGDRGQRFTMVAGHARGIAISAHPKGVFALELEQVGHFVERVGNLGIGHLVQYTRRRWLHEAHRTERWGRGRRRSFFSTGAKRCFAAG